VPLRTAASAKAKQLPVAAQALQEFPGRHGAQPHGSQLNCQRNAFELLADLNDFAAIVVAEREPRQRVAGSVDEKPDCFEVVRRSHGSCRGHIRDG